MCQLGQARVLAALVTAELARRALQQAPGERLHSANNTAMACCFPCVQINLYQVYSYVLSAEVAAPRSSMSQNL